MRRARVRPRRKKRKKSNFKGFFIVLLLLLIIAAGGYVYISPQFERVAPAIKIEKNIYAGIKKPLKIQISDNVALKSAKVTLISDSQEVPIYEQKFLLPQKNKTIEVKLPKEIFNSKKNNWVLKTEIQDSSMWNFLMGNKATALSKLNIDSTPPVINIIAHSPSIAKGGTALVIVKVDDQSLDKVYIEVGNNTTFIPIKYRKNNIFASLFAWPFKQENFSANVVAVDKAGNIKKYPITIGKLHRKYRVSKIRASDKFINGKISELAASDPDYANITDKFEKFRAINELMRKKNEDLIHKLSRNVTPFKGKWHINAFVPLKRGKKVADFGDHRFYYYKTPDNIISTSYHVGYDFASIKQDNLYTSNGGKVVFASSNGIYGNMPLIDHGFGLYTLYGHCSSMAIKKGDTINTGAFIGKTGVSGLALGDHTHFGILVQGVEVLPLDWLSNGWIKKSITDIFSKADRIIGYNSK